MKTLREYLSSSSADNKICNENSDSITSMLKNVDSEVSNILSGINQELDNFNQSIEKHNSEIHNADTVSEISEQEEITINLNHSISTEDISNKHQETLTIKDIDFEAIAQEFFYHIIEQNHTMYTDSISLAKKTAAKFNLNEQEVIELHKKDFYHNLSENDLNIEAISFSESVFINEFKNFIQSQNYEDEFKQIIGSKILENYLDYGILKPTNYDYCKRKFQNVLSFLDTDKNNPIPKEDKTCEYLLDFILNSNNAKHFTITHFYPEIKKLKETNKFFGKAYDEVMFEIEKKPEYIDTIFRETLSKSIISQYASSGENVRDFQYKAVLNIMNFIMLNELYINLNTPENKKALNLIPHDENTNKNYRSCIETENLNLYNTTINNFFTYCKKQDLLRTLTSEDTTVNPRNEDSFKI